MSRALSALSSARADATSVRNRPSRSSTSLSGWPAATSRRRLARAGAVVQSTCAGPDDAGSDAPCADSDTHGYDDSDSNADSDFNGYVNADSDPAADAMIKPARTFEVISK